MSNHYHFIFKTPEPNMVEGMGWFQNTWTRRIAPPPTPPYGLEKQFPSNLPHQPRPPKGWKSNFLAIFDWNGRAGEFDLRVLREPNPIAHEIPPTLMKSLPTTTCILALGLCTISANAALVSGVTAISSFSTASANRTPVSAVNGSGLNASATPDVPGSWTHQGGNGEFGGDLNWLAFARADLNATNTDVANHWIGFDLGSRESLDSMNLFNFGVSTGGNNDRGVNQGDIYYRSDSFGNNSDNNNVAFDNTGWTLLGTAGAQTFAIGPNDGSFQGATNVPLGGISARYFAIDINSDHGDGDFVGVGEVQFFTPEPSTSVLCGFAAIALLVRRRR